LNPVDPGTAYPGARVKYGSSRGEERGGSEGKNGRNFALITNRVTSEDLSDHPADMVMQGSGAGEVELDVSMAGSVPSRSDRVLERITTYQYIEA
jgi:hypothetical protein